MIRRTISRANAKKAQSMLVEMARALAGAAASIDLAMHTTGPKRCADLDRAMDVYYMVRVRLSETNPADMGFSFKTTLLEELAIREAQERLNDKAFKKPSDALKAALATVKKKYAHGRCRACKGPALPCMKRHLRGRSCA